MLRTKYDMPKREYLPYLKNYISTHSKKELQQKKTTNNREVPLERNFLSQVLCALEEKQIIAILKLLEKEDKLDYYQEVHDSTLVETILTGDDFKEGYDELKEYVRKKISLVSPKIKLSEILILLNEVREGANIDNSLRQFFSKPFLNFYSNKEQHMRLRMFRDLGTIGDDAREYLKRSDLAKDLISDFVKKLEKYEVYDNSHFVDYQVMHRLNNYITVSIKEFELPTIENLTYIFKINPFYKETMDRTDIKILKELFFKKIVPKQWDELLTRLNETNIISLKRSKTLKIVGLTVNELNNEKSVFDELEANGKIRRDYHDTYSLRGFNLLDTIGMKIINVKKPYLKLQYKDIAEAKRVLEEVGMWGDFEHKLKEKIKSRFPTIQEHLNVPIELNNIDYVEDEKGYFKVEVGF